MRAFLFYGVPKSLFVILLLAPLWVHAQFSVMEDAVALSANCVQLTAAEASQRGAAWSECPLDVSHPFSIELTVCLRTCGEPHIVLPVWCASAETVMKVYLYLIAYVIDDL